MATITLGLELGPTHVRAVALSSNLRDTAMVFADSRPLPAEYDYDIIAETAAELIRSSKITPNTIIAGLPLRDVLVRRFRFPFTSPSKIRQVLAFELEPTLPWLLEDVIYSFQKGPQTENTQTVLCAVIPKTTLAAYLGALNAKGIDPDRIDISASGLYSLSKHLVGVLSDNPLFLHIQHDETILHHSQKNIPVLFRTIPVGIEGLFSPTEIETLDLEELPVQNNANKLERDITISLLATRESKETPPPDMVVVTGCAALSKPALQELSKRIGHDVVVVDGYPPGIAASIDGIDSDVAENALALGLACQGMRNSDGFDFRVAEFGRTDKTLSWKKESTIIGACLAVIVLAWVASVLVNISLKQRQLNAAHSEIATLFQQTIPDIGSGFTDSQRISILRNRVAQLRNDGASGAEGSIKMVDILGRISRSIPDAIDVQVTSLTLSQRVARINASTDSFQNVQEIKKDLQEQGGFKDVTVRDSKTGAGGQGVDFVMEIDVAAIETPASPIPQPVPATPTKADETSLLPPVPPSHAVPPPLPPDAQRHSDTTSPPHVNLPPLPPETPQGGSK